MTTKQDKFKPDDMNRNPTGKGGFGDNPQNRNTTGRPKNEVSITYWIKQYLAETEEGRTKTRAQELAERIVYLAYVKENVQIIKELLNRIEGSTPISIETDKEVAQLLQQLLNPDDTNKDTDTGDQGADQEVLQG